MKRKVLRYFTYFLIFILTCTIVSRGVYAYQIPQVTVVRAEAKEITHKIEVDGSLQEVFEKAVIVISGIRVEEICVRQGDTVKKGDILFRLSKKGIQNKVQNISKQLAWEERKLSQLKTAKEQEKRKYERKIENAEERAEKEIENSDEEQKELVEKAKQEYEAAKQQLLSYISFQEYLQEEQSKNAEYQTLKKTAERKGAKKEDKEAFEIFSQTFLLTV